MSAGSSPLRSSSASATGSCADDVAVGVDHVCADGGGSAGQVALAASVTWPRLEAHAQPARRELGGDLRRPVERQQEIRRRRRLDGEVGRKRGRVRVLGGVDAWAQGDDVRGSGVGSAIIVPPRSLGRVAGLDPMSQGHRPARPAD